MGCFKSKEETIFDKLDYKLEPMGVEQFDKFLENGVKVLSRIEDIRKLIIKKWGNLLFSSGAIVLEKPELSHCIYGILYQMARESKEDPLSFVELKTDRPFISIKPVNGRKEVSIVIRETKEDFDRYVHCCMDSEKIILKILKSVEDLDDIFIENFQKWVDEYSSGVDNNPFKVKPFIDKAKKNKKRVERGLNLMITISGMISRIIPLIVQVKYIDWKKFKERENTLYDNVFLNIYEEFQRVKSYSDNRKLYWTFTESDRMSSFESYLLIYRKIEETEEVDSMIDQIKDDINNLKVQRFEQQRKEKEALEEEQNKLEKTKTMVKEKRMKMKIERVFKDEEIFEEFIELVDFEMPKEPKKEKRKQSKTNSNNEIIEEEGKKSSRNKFKIPDSHRSTTIMKLPRDTFKITENFFRSTTIKKNKNEEKKHIEQIKEQIINQNEDKQKYESSNKIDNNLEIKLEENVDIKPEENKNSDNFLKLHEENIPNVIGVIPEENAEKNDSEVGINPTPEIKEKAEGLQASDKNEIDENIIFKVKDKEDSKILEKKDQEKSRQINKEIDEENIPEKQKDKEESKSNVNNPQNDNISSEYDDEDRNMLLDISKNKVDQKLLQDISKSKIKSNLNKSIESSVIKKDKLLPIFFPKISPLKNWNIRFKKSYFIDKENLSPTCTEINPETDHFYIGTKGGRIDIFNILSGEYISSLTFHKKQVTSLCYLHDGITMISSDKEGNLMKWDIITQRSETIFKKSSTSIRNVQYLFDGLNICFSINSTLFFFDLIENKEVPLSSYTFKEKITKLVWMKDLKYLAVGLNSGVIKIFSVKDMKKKEICGFSMHSKSIVQMCLGKFNGINVLLSCGEDNIINIFDLHNKLPMKTINSPTEALMVDLVYCNDERSILTAHQDGSLYLHNYISINNIKKQISSKEEKIMTVDLYGDGLTIIVGYKNSEIDIFYTK